MTSSTKHMALYTYVTPFTRLHLHCLPTWLRSVHSQDKDHMNTRVTIVTRIIVSPTWWLNLEQLGVGVPFITATHSTTIVTDASFLGWGPSTEKATLYQALGPHTGLQPAGTESGPPGLQGLSPTHTFTECPNNVTQNHQGFFI